MSDRSVRPARPRRVAAIAALLAPVAAAATAIAQPTIVEPGWYLAEELELNRVTSARMNPVDGRVYAVYRDTGPDAGIYVFDRSGLARQIVAVENPYGLAIDASGDVFYSLDFPGTIERLPFGATTPSTWVTGFHAGDDDPIGLEIAPPSANFAWIAPGEALVADRGSGGPDEVWKWDSASAEGESAVHTDDGTLVNPVDVAIGATRAYVADDVDAPGNGVIYEIDTAGNLSPVPGAGVDRPTGIGIDPTTQDLIVADAELERIVRIDPISGAVSDMFTGFIGFAWSGLQVFDHGNAVLVSDLTGDRVYLFRKLRTPCTGAPFATIDDPDPQPGGRFGELVAAHDNLVLAYDDLDESLELFELQPDGTWNALFDSASGFPIDAIDIGSDHIAIAIDAGVNKGVAASPTNTSEPFSLVALEVTSSALAVSLAGHSLFVGFPRFDLDDGLVHEYRFDTGSQTWSFVQAITAPLPAPQIGGTRPGFGAAIDCDGDTLLIGAPGTDLAGGEIDAGYGFFYKRNPSTSLWELFQGRQALTQAAGERFGSAVAVCGSAAAAGAPFADNAPFGDTGTIDRYAFDSQGEFWSVVSLSANESGGQFGATLAITGDTLAVGAPGVSVGADTEIGRVRYYTRTGPADWDLIASFVGSVAGDRVGHALALTKQNLLLFGLPDADVTDVGVVVPIHLGDCPDCNADGLPDTVQIVAGVADADDDRVPDECEPIANTTKGSFHATIQEAIDRAKDLGALPGAPDLITIPSGTYAESFDIDRRVLVVGETTPSPPLISGDGSSYTVEVIDQASAAIADIVLGDPGAKSASGIAIRVSDADLVASRVTITGYDLGVALLELGAEATFSRCTMSNNGGLGGSSIQALAGTTLSVQDCDLLANGSAVGGDAVISATNARVMIARSRFVGNLATFGPACIEAVDTPLLVHDSLFLGNEVQVLEPVLSAGASDPATTTEIVNCTVVANRATSSDFATMLFSGFGQNVVKNTIFTNNDPVVPVSGAAAVSYCLADEALAGLNNLLGAPMFLEAPTPGPDTVWGTADDTGDLTPWTGSPAIDAGDSQAYANAVAFLPNQTIDLVGNPRSEDALQYPNSGVEFGGVIDIGAIEAPALVPDPCPCLGDADGDCITNIFDFAEIAANFGETGLTPFTNGDLDGDGDVDVFDFGILAGDFGCGV